MATDKTGRAITALRAVTLHHRILNRIELVAVFDALDRDHVSGVELIDILNAAVQRLVFELFARDAADRYGASAAVSLGANDLGAAGVSCNSADTQSAAKTRQRRQRGVLCR